MSYMREYLTYTSRITLSAKNGDDQVFSGIVQC
jgi:hypothetical protein